MTVLRLVSTAGTAIGPALASIDEVVLARRDGVAFAEVPVATVPRLARALAFAGIATVPCDADLAPPAGLLLALGTDLAPVPSDLVGLDVVRIRRLELGPATREALRRPLASLLPPNAAARLRCRALLRGEEVALAWRRQAWASRAALRSPRARRSLRPVVFDREAALRPDLPGRISSRDDSLARWLFA